MGVPSGMGTMMADPGARSAARLPSAPPAAGGVAVPGSADHGDPPQAATTDATKTSTEDVVQRNIEAVPPSAVSLYHRSEVLNSTTLIEPGGFPLTFTS